MYNHTYYTLTAVLFGLLTAGLFVLLMLGLAKVLKHAGFSADRQKQLLLRTGLGLGGWLALLAGLGFAGFFAEFDTIPPRFPLMMVPPLVVIIRLASSPKASAILRQVPLAWLTAVQSFRIVMELLLWLGYLGFFVPKQMTFEGLNFDVLVGLTAPLIAWMVFAKEKWPRGAGIAWNLLSLALLVNILTIAVLSAPTPFQVFTAAPANTFIANFPFTWLPGFVVPFALFCHVVSLKQLLFPKDIKRVATA